MAATGIPLHCNICPKKPDFSDVSHLLTHIASKGHLSNYYKVKVRSSHEESSRRLIEAYDHWYAEWSVEELMSERMNQKDKRRARPRPAARPTLAAKVEASASRPTRLAAMSNLLDPRLGEQHQIVKLEHSVSPSPTLQYTGPMLRHSTTFAPHMQYWSAESRASSHSYTNGDYETSSEYSDPSERRHYRHTGVASSAVEDDSAVMIDPMAVSESTKLKGVYWPGMDIFDSATPEMRRKRNQKKDSSVVEQLELNSQEVEATELIFTPQGSFKRQRRISCSDSDEEGDFDIKNESPEPLRRRTALAFMDTNIRHHKQFKRPTFSYTSRVQYENRANPGRGFSQGIQTCRRKLFNVFQDEEDDSTVTQPNQMSYLTAGFTHPHSQNLVPPTATYKLNNQALPFESKENAFPMFRQTVIDNPHSHQNSKYPYASYLHGLDHEYEHSHGINLDHACPQFNNYLFNLQNHEHVEDDERTITAPPSPSTD